ncbi:MAG: hypothetical protein JXA07_16305 [Spirochaetes bacterium]|nr:hypothetical protein [Spirochaetota bacterium]
MKKNVIVKASVFFLILSLSHFAYPDASKTDKRIRIKQYGITWIFDHPVKSGQFVNGDWWIVGPATIVRIIPAPGPAHYTENNNITVNRWGDTSLRNDASMRNGSMIIRRAGMLQSYDSRAGNFNKNAGVSLPLQLAPGTSLISTISNPTLPVDNFCHKIMWRSEKKVQTALQTAAVLTCLAESPPADAFRPAYAGEQKQIYRSSRLQWELLSNLKPPGDVPPWDDFERYFQRPWIDHVTSWIQEELVPNENQPCYGREYARLVSIASLMVHLDVSKKRKEKLVIGLVQLGIDLSGIAHAGGSWNEGGGHSSGRKWPILFASLMLDEPSLAKLPESAIFQEDTQTYYGKGWFGQTALWQMILHHGKRDPYEEKRPETWNKWDRTSESYRCCCTAVSWVGTALAARQMKAIQLWGHDAFFDYVDRWMQKDDPYTKRRGKHKRPSCEAKTFDKFVDGMWEAYRQSTPQQDMSKINMKFVSEKGKWKWVHNPKDK